MTQLPFLFKKCLCLKINDKIDNCSFTIINFLFLILTYLWSLFMVFTLLAPFDRIDRKVLSLIIGTYTLNVKFVAVMQLSKVSFDFYNNI